MNLTARLLLFTFVSLSTLLTGCKPDIQEGVLVSHEARYPGIRKKYVSQSILRLANVKQDPDFEKLIRDVRNVVLYMPPREDTTYQITDLRSNLRSGGYEELMDVRTAEAGRVTLWVLEKGKEAHYLALLDTTEDDYILEIDGQINLEYLSAIQIADQSTLMDLLKGSF